jgi:hypothetical protein
MSSSEEILTQIDRALEDPTVSTDAMRCRPEPDPAPLPPVSTVPFTAGRWLP